MNCGQVTVTCGVQGPQGPPGSSITRPANVTVSATLNVGQNLTLFTNSGATGEVDLTLPGSVYPFVAMSFSLLVTAAQKFGFVAPAGVIITNGTDSSSPGGSISCNIIGNFVSIVMVSPTQWIITNITGIWDLG